MEHATSGSTPAKPRPDPATLHKTTEAVNHPAHYNAGQIETITVIEDQGWSEGFCLGNAVKYITRARHKGKELEDLEKAAWYLARRIAWLKGGGK